MHLLVLINTKVSGLDNDVVVGLEVLVGEKEASFPKDIYLLLVVILL